MTTKLNTADHVEVNEIIAQCGEKLESLSEKISAIAHSSKSTTLKARALTGLSRLLDNTSKVIVNRHDQLTKPFADEQEEITVSFSPLFYRINRLKTLVQSQIKENRGGE